MCVIYLYFIPSKLPLSQKITDLFSHPRIFAYLCICKRA